MTEIFQLGQILHLSLPFADANEQVMRAFCPNPTWCTFSTALDPEEVGKHDCKVNDANAVIANQ